MHQPQMKTPLESPAEAYESFFVPAMFAPLAELLLERAAPLPGDRVLDVACGTGIVARRAARLVREGGRVTGLDPSGAMLAVARSVAASEGLEIAWREGRAEALPFSDGSADLVLCQNGLQFVPDKPAAATEMHRVLADRGRVGLAVWLGLDHHPFWRVLHEAMLEHLGAPAMRAPFALGDADELRALLVGAAFADVEIEPVSLTARFADPQRFVALQVAASAAAIPQLKQLDAEERKRLADAVAASMAATLREHIVDDRMDVPMHAHIARARRG